jgi:hypothetical protein
VKPGVKSNKCVSYKEYFMSSLYLTGSHYRHNKSVETMYVEIFASFSTGGSRNGNQIEEHFL